MKKAIVITGIYQGRTGVATNPNKIGNVMFYPKEGKNPYRVCLSKDKIKYINETN